VLPLGGNLRKLNTGAQLQTSPYPTASKSFLYSIDIMAKSATQILTLKSITDKQTNRATDKQRFFAALAGEIQAQPNLAW